MIGYHFAERKMTNVSKVKKNASVDLSESKNQNRHALPEDVKEIVSPRKIIPMSRRDSFTLLKR